MPEFTVKDRAICDLAELVRDMHKEMTMTAEDWAKERAELAVDNAETAAQMEVTDHLLRDSLIRNVAVALTEAANRIEPGRCSHCGAFHQPNESRVNEGLPT